MKINPIDEAIANGEKPDFTKYDKRTVMASDYFQSVFEKSNKKQDAQDRADPVMQARLAEGQSTEMAIVNELRGHGFASIQSVEDIKNTPKAHAKAIEIMAKHLASIENPAHAWGMSLQILQIKSKHVQPLIVPLRAFVKNNPVKHIQAILNLTQAIKASKDEEVINQAIDILRSVDQAAIQTILKRLERK